MARGVGATARLVISPGQGDRESPRAMVARGGEWNGAECGRGAERPDRKSTRLNSSH